MDRWMFRLLKVLDAMETILFNIIDLGVFFEGDVGELIKELNNIQRCEKENLEDCKRSLMKIYYILLQYINFLPQDEKGIVKESLKSFDSIIETVLSRYKDNNTLFETLKSFAISILSEITEIS